MGQIFQKIIITFFLGFLVYLTWARDIDIIRWVYKKTIGVIPIKPEESPSGTYTPLSSELKDKLIEDLRIIHDQYHNLDVAFSIRPEKGVRVRENIAKDLANILVTSGFKAKAGAPMITNLNGNVVIMLNPDDTELANKLFKVIARFIDTRFQGREETQRSRGTFEIHIIGDPLFSSSGVVTFR